MLPSTGVNVRRNESAEHTLQSLYLVLLTICLTSVIHFAQFFLFHHFNHAQKLGPMRVLLKRSHGSSKSPSPIPFFHLFKRCLS